MCVVVTEKNCESLEFDLQKSQSKIPIQEFNNVDQYFFKCRTYKGFSTSGMAAFVQRPVVKYRVQVRQNAAQGVISITDIKLVTHSFHDSNNHGTLPDFM